MGVPSFFGETEDGFIHDQFFEGVSDERPIFRDQDTVTCLEHLDGSDDVLQPFQGNVCRDHSHELFFPPELPVKWDGVGGHEDLATAAGVVGFTPLRPA